MKRFPFMFKTSMCDLQDDYGAALATHSWHSWPLGKRPLAQEVNRPLVHLLSSAFNLQLPAAMITGEPSVPAECHRRRLALIIRVCSWSSIPGIPIIFRRRRQHKNRDVIIRLHQPPAPPSFACLRIEYISHVRPSRGF